MFLSVSQIKIHIKSLRFAFRIEESNDINSSVGNLKFYHHGIDLIEDPETHSFDLLQLRWISCLSIEEQVHSLQLYQAHCHFECECIDLRVQKANDIVITGLDIEYSTDIVSLLMSPLIGYKLLNAMNIDYKYYNYPKIKIKFNSLKVDLDDLLFIDAHNHFYHILSELNQNKDEHQMHHHSLPEPHFIFNTLTQPTDCRQELLPITITSPIVINTDLKSISIKIKAESPFKSLLDDRNVPLLHILGKGINANILITSKSMQYEKTQNDDLFDEFVEITKLFDSSSNSYTNDTPNIKAELSSEFSTNEANASYIVAFEALAIDLPSIFESDVTYKHGLSPLYPYKHRLVQFNCFTLSGKSDEKSLFCSIDELLVQYHPAMIEVVAPIVCMLSQFSLYPI